MRSGVAMGSKGIGWRPGCVGGPGRFRRYDRHFLPIARHEAEIVEVHSDAVLRTKLPKADRDHVGGRGERFGDLCPGVLQNILMQIPHAIVDTPIALADHEAVIASLIPRVSRPFVPELKRVLLAWNDIDTIRLGFQSQGELDLVTAGVGLGRDKVGGRDLQPWRKPNLEIPVLK